MPYYIDGIKHIYSIISLWLKSKRNMKLSRLLMAKRSEMLNKLNKQNFSEGSAFGMKVI